MDDRVDEEERRVTRLDSVGSRRGAAEDNRLLFFFLSYVKGDSCPGTCAQRAVEPGEQRPRVVLC